jgi:hypothetical protein
LLALTGKYGSSYTPFKNVIPILFSVLFFGGAGDEEIKRKPIHYQKKKKRKPI